MCDHAACCATWLQGLILDKQRVDTWREQAERDVLGAGAQGQESGIRFAIVLWGELNDKCRTLLDCPVLTFADVLAKGHRASASFSPQPLSADQLATIVYTSGTTGNPKVHTGAARWCISLETSPAVFTHSSCVHVACKLGCHAKSCQRLVPTHSRVGH